MDQDSHVKLFDKLIFVIDLKRSGFLDNIKYIDIPLRLSSRPFKNYRLMEYLKNDEVDFYKGSKSYRKRYD